MDPQAILDGKTAAQSGSKNPIARTMFTENDLFIAVMGITGSGKSTLISRCTKTTVAVGHSLTSHTQEFQVYPVSYGDKTVHLIDTPGFDDTKRPDIDVLRDISYWLSRAYADNIQLTGIVYLHRIIDPRMGGVALKNLNMFKKLCGEASFSSVVLATTFWESVPTELGNKRESELRTTQNFYASMLQKGAMMMRHTDNEHSAMSIVSYLVSRGTTTILNLQRELGDGKRLDETEAGAELEKEMIEQKKAFNRRLAETEQAMKQAIKANDEEHAAELAKQQDMLSAKIKAAEKGQEDLRIDMERLFEEKEEQIRQALEQLDEERKERQKVVLERAKELREWQDAQRKAETLFEEKRKEQQDEIRKLKEQNQRTEESVTAQIAAQKKQFEDRNSEIEANLKKAQEEEERRQLELLEAQVAMASVIMENSQRPEVYHGDPPGYADVMQAMQAQSAYPQPIQDYGLSRSELAATALGFAGAAAIAAPLVTMCSIM